MKDHNCCHCGETFNQSPRIKNQQYCPSKPCQQYRKNQWEKEKLEKDGEYKEKRRVQQARWRKVRPAHEYQKQYRATHPNYEKANRAQQSRRNHARKIVNTDALQAVPLVKSGIYVMRLYNEADDKKIVNTDALIVEIKTYRNIQPLTG